MDADTANNVITAGAGIIGALVGGGASIWATSLTQKSERTAEIERERRADERQRRDAAEHRTQIAAKRCDEMITDLTEQIREWDRSGSITHETSDYFDLTRGKERAVDAEAQYLPPPLRARVSEAMSVLRRGDLLHQELYNYDPLTWAAHEVGRETHRVIAAWQRGEDLPLRSDGWCDLVLAAENAEAAWEQMVSSHHGTAEMDAMRSSWRAAHRDAITKIKRR